MPTTNTARAREDDRPVWRLIFLLAGSWSACARMLAVLAALTILAALALGAAATAATYLLIQLVPLLAVLPPAPSAAIAGGSVTMLTGSVLGRQAARAWRSIRKAREDATPDIPG